MTEEIKNLHTIISSNIELHIKELTYKNDLQDIYNYSLLPAGKLFRPIIFNLLYLDLMNLKNISELDNSDMVYINSALEFHHAYTLLHDDMPAMDNDDFRRGKLSGHKKFGQWKALLAGDGLLNASYQLLSKCSDQHISKLLKIFTKLLGPKGLIRGQYLDLSGESTSSLSTTIETHVLKTSRLIQTSLLSALVISNKYNLKNIKKVFILGNSLGVVFQLIDDLLELITEIGQHELKVNPWINFPIETNVYLIKELTKLKHILEINQYNHLKDFIKINYLTKSVNIIIENRTNIEKYNLELNPVISALDFS